jgi:hypothetical protein
MPQLDFYTYLEQAIHIAFCFITCYIIFKKLYLNNLNKTMNLREKLKNNYKDLQQKNKTDLKKLYELILKLFFKK